MPVAFAATATTAQAQTQVSLYGLIDHGIHVVDHAPTGRVAYQNANGINGNRVGFSGREVLGNGLAALFVLENGFDGSTGALGMGGRAFGSQSFVGMDTPVGQVLAGRQVNVDAFTTGAMSAAGQWAGLAGAHPGDNGNLYSSYRVPNAVKFVSAPYAGFQYHALYGFGERRGSQGQVAAAAVRYEQGPLKFTASVTGARNPNTGLAAGTSPDTNITPASNYLGSTIVSGYASARDFYTAGTGVNYDVGAATLGFVYVQSEYKGLGDPASGPNRSGFTGSAVFRNAELNFKYAVSPTVQLAAEYVHTRRNSVATATDAQGLGGATYRQLTLGARYALSRRTFVYAIVGGQRASGIGSDNQAAVAHIFGGPASALADQRVYRVGMQHRF